MQKKDFFNIRNLTVFAMLIALEIVLSRGLSWSMWNQKIGFAFVPVVVAAIYYGPLGAAVVAALADFIGAMLFPIGPYFPGFTLSQFLVGLTYGIFLHKKEGMLNVVLAVLITQMVISLLLSSFWISILYGTPFEALLPTRIGQAVLMTAVEIIIIPLLIKKLPKQIFIR